jgi:acetylornithine/succinyldiaminopimelate/putrescine aminotransferase
MSGAGEPYPSREATFDAFAGRVSAGKVRTFREFGIDVVMGERGGAWFEDAFSGRRFMNCHCNGGVFNLGHRHPAVLAAVREALSRLDVGNHHLVSGWRARLAERLCASAGGGLVGAVFGVSGGEVVDLALKLARGVTGRRGVVSARGGYHGHTGLAVAAGDPQYREPFGASLPDFAQVPFDDLTALEAAVGANTAAVILEPIPATLGMPVPGPGYLAGAADLCRRRGARLVLDEVQTGLGRTGRMWAFQHEGIAPDAVVVGKGLSGGVYPITAALVSAEMKAFLDERPFAHVSTFGGAEPGCAAALAVLDVVEAPGFLPRVGEVSDRLGAAFEGLPFRLRRRGLMMGFQFPAQGAGLMAASLMYDVGVFCLPANNDTSVLQFLPPLVLSDGEVDDLAGRVRKVFGGLA